MEDFFYVLGSVGFVLLDSLRLPFLKSDDMESIDYKRKLLLKYHSDELANLAE